jgi:hypothetical protein
MARSDLLTQVRFSEVHAPTPISRGDHLVYHAVGDRRIIAAVEVQSEVARYDATREWERQWPLVLDVRPLLKVGRVSQSPPTDVVGVKDDFAHQSFLPLTPVHYEAALDALRAAGAH